MQPFQWFLSFPAYRIFRRQNRGKIRYYEEAGNALFFAKTTTKSCYEIGTEIGSGFGPFDCPHPGDAETGSGLRGFHRLSVWCQDSFRLCGSLRQPIHIWAPWGYRQWQWHPVCDVHLVYSLMLEMGNGVCCIVVKNAGETHSRGAIIHRPKAIHTEIFSVLFWSPFHYRDPPGHLPPQMGSAPA